VPPTLARPRRRRRSEPLDLDAHINAAAGLIDLPIPAACRPGVRSFLALAAGMAATLDQMELPDDDFALAPVLRLPDIDTP